MLKTFFPALIPIDDNITGVGRHFCHSEFKNPEPLSVRMRDIGVKPWVSPFLKLSF
jgi:hypothetical protein